MDTSSEEFIKLKTMIKNHYDSLSLQEKFKIQYLGFKYRIEDAIQNLKDKWNHCCK